MRALREWRISDGPSGEPMLIETQTAGEGKRRCGDPSQTRKGPASRRALDVLLPFLSPR
ncbi:hypothetical protein BN2537_11539 [Streptomyces venezuelae]|nr:hypothetical protein BN2537_11539 [Streptomyces venezuelae]